MKKNFLYIVAALLVCGGMLCGCGKATQVESSSLPASSQVSSQEEETVQTYQLYNKLEYEFPSSWEQSTASFDWKLEGHLDSDSFSRTTGNSSDGFKTAASVSFWFHQEDDPNYIQSDVDFSIEQFEWELCPITTIAGMTATHLTREKINGEKQDDYILSFGEGVYCTISTSLETAYDPTGEVAQEIEMILDKIKVIG